MEFSIPPLAVRAKDRAVCAWQCGRRCFNGAPPLELAVKIAGLSFQTIGKLRPGDPQQAGSGGEIAVATRHRFVEQGPLQYP